MAKESNFNTDQYELIFNTISDHIIKLNPEWSKMDVGILISKYDEKYGLDDLTGFIIRYRELKKDESIIKFNLIHDLFEFYHKNKGFSPRTTGYGKYLFKSSLIT